MHCLQIKNLCAGTNEKEILKDVNLKINSGEIHAIMGPNGTGKSTLASVIMGHPDYKATSGDILFDNESILDKEVDERARLGLFLAFQYPSEISGVANSEFIHTAMRAKGDDISVYKFALAYDKACRNLKIDDKLANRHLNLGFSGGEKKRNEILQMQLLKPEIAILDEIDSGLDVDALKLVGESVYRQAKEKCGCLVITHYERLLDYIKPDFVHVMINGTIVYSGGSELVKRIDSEGYDWIKGELGITEEIDEVISLGSCRVARGKHDE